VPGWIGPAGRVGRVLKAHRSPLRAA
jgi:hypothetical protein